MASKKQKSGGQVAGQESPGSVGDNRRAGDTDGNAAAGNSKSKGVTQPADEPPTKGAEKA